MEDIQITEEPKVREKKEAYKLTLPHAVVVASLILGVAVLIGTGKFFVPRSEQKVESAKAPSVPTAAPANSGTGLDKVNPVTSADHIRGNKNAPVKVIVYSDFECAFCKSYHATLKMMENEYVNSGKVAWIERHFPLDSIHPNARNIAEASECINQLKGNDAFWKFTDQIFASTKSNNTMKGAELDRVAESTGVDVATFNNCLNAKKFNQRITDDALNATQSGGSGTPWTVIIAPNGKKFSVGGAVPYESLKQTIEQALSSK